MNKKIQLTISQRRQRSTFSRTLEIFERKFDGFPASAPNLKTSVPTNPNASNDIDFGEILQDLLDQMPDATPCTGSGENVETKVLSTDDGGTTWQFPVPIKYVIKAWIDGLQVLQYQDFDIVSGEFVPNSPLSADSIVVVKYVSK